MTISEVALNVLALGPGGYWGEQLRMLSVEVLRRKENEHEWRVVDTKTREAHYASTEEEATKLAWCLADGHEAIIQRRKLEWIEWMVLKR